MLWFAFNKRSLTSTSSTSRGVIKLWFAFNKRSLTSIAQRITTGNCCDLLSTNDLWHLHNAEYCSSRVVICFQQTIFDINQTDVVNSTRLWFAFNKRSLTSTPVQYITVPSCDLLSTNDLWHHHQHYHQELGSCDLLSTNDLWHHSYRGIFRGIVVICFQQTIFDINLMEFRGFKIVVICFQQTIFDIQDRCHGVHQEVVICFQQTIFDICLSSNNRFCQVVICFQQTIFDIPYISSVTQAFVVICFQQTIFDINTSVNDAQLPVVICFQQTIFDIGTPNWYSTL